MFSARLSPDVTIYHTADLHLGHRKVIDHCQRPFRDEHDMDRGLVERWNDTVRTTDVVWVHGDVALDDRKLEPVSQLHGYKILVAGNHDSCWLGHSRRQRALNKIKIYRDAGFAAVVPEGIIPIHLIIGLDGMSLSQTSVALSHLPYRGDHTPEDRYVEKRPVDLGLPLLCGHVHNAWKTLGSQINVGVDVWDYAPVNEDTILRMINDMRYRQAEEEITA